MNSAAPHPELPAYLAHNWPAYLDLLHQMVLVNSFTLNPGGVNRLGTLTAERFAELGFEAEAVPAEGVDVAFLPIGESNVELLKPTVADSGVARFLEKRGPGIHHMCFEVDDIDATMEQLRAHNVQLINEQPQVGHGGRKYAFVHPKSTGGVLVELYQLSDE